MEKFPYWPTSLQLLLSTVCRIQFVWDWNKEDLERFLTNHKESKIKILEDVYKYNDPFFKTLHKIVRNVPILSSLDQTTIRNLCLAVKKVHRIRGSKIIRLKEICSTTFLLYSGVVWVYVVDPETQERTVFQYLSQGSWFNFITSILGYSSIFEFEADSEWTLMALEAQDVIRISK